MNFLIDAFIVGAQKAGTTSLLKYLSEHPDIAAHVQLEFTYFVPNKEKEEEFEDYISRCYSADAATKKIRLAKYANAYVHEACIANLKKHNPDCKLIFLLRDPVKRAFSAWSMGYGEGWIHDPFEQIFSEIKANENGTRSMWYEKIVRYGFYDESLKMIYRYFPPEQVCIVYFESLVKDPGQVSAQILEFLGLSQSEQIDYAKRHNETFDISNKFLKKTFHWMKKESNPGKRFIRRILPYPAFLWMGRTIGSLFKGKAKVKHELLPDTKGKLYLFYKPHVQELKRLTGAEINVWKEFSE